MTTPPTSKPATSTGSRRSPDPETPGGEAERFATRGADRFAGLDWRPGIGGVPLLDGAAAVLECHNRSRYEEGDHVIFVGEVEQCRYRADASPLIFHGGRFYTELPL